MENREEILFFAGFRLLAEEVFEEVIAAETTAEDDAVTELVLVVELCRIKAAWLLAETPVEPPVTPAELLTFATPPEFEFAPEFERTLSLRLSSLSF